MANMSPRFVISLNLAVEAIDKAKRNCLKPEVVQKLELHIADLRKLRAIILHAISSPKFDFESVIRNNVAAGEVKSGPEKQYSDPRN